MRHLDLFSGIGGFALASTWVWGDEYENVGHSEVEPYACKVYHKHFPESECLGDITKIEWKEGQADLITGGFPCQPHSVAGKRRASADERDLWGECVRAIRDIRPRYALFENVPGKGRFLGSNEYRGAKTSEALRTSSNDPALTNPLFVEWMMGYPTQWTDLEHSETP